MTRAACRSVLAMSKRNWLVRGGVVAVAAIGLTFVLTLPPPPDDREHASKPASPAAGDADQMLQAAIGEARSKLGFSEPVPIQVLFGCLDDRGVLDTASTACPASMIATLQDSARPDRFALAAAGKMGLIVSPAPREAVMALPPARCTPGRLLAAARARGLGWKPESQLFLAYGPSPNRGAEWAVTRDRLPLLTLTDAECTASPH